MWRCEKCGEEIEEAFDACWNCGTSIEGVEDPEFRVKATEASDVVETSEGRVGWDSFFAGGIVTAILAFFDYAVPWLVSASLTRRQLGSLVAASLMQCLFFALVGAIAGWLGGRSERLVHAAAKGAAVFFVLLCFCLVMGPPLPRTSSYAIIALEVNFLALGAVAATAGSIVGRRRRRQKLEEPFQFSISDMFLLMVLATVLFASLAVLRR